MGSTYPVPTLGPEVRVPVFGTPGLSMRIIDDLRKAVVFFGYADRGPGRGGMVPIGTGFLFDHEDVGYLITARHLSHDLGSDPFIIRVNTKNGGSSDIDVDGASWLEHPDPTVDVSAIPLTIFNSSPLDVTYITDKQFGLVEGQLRADNVGVGSETYTIGLFRLLSGKKRNLPISHHGHIALVPEDEKIPVVDWTDPMRQRRVFVEGYLVESQSLSGLSGSPVFVRPELDLDLTGIMDMKAGDPRAMRPHERPEIVGPRVAVRLLGLWQGSWEAPPDEVRSAQTGSGAKVPVGMGVVVPYRRILELLDMPEEKARRAAFRGRYDAVVEPQSVPRPAAAPPASDENPNHREDFKSLVRSAGKARQSDGET